MFSQFNERFQSEVELKELFEPDRMGQIIHYMYFKHIYLTPKNAQDLLCLANYLQLDHLVRVCSDYILQRVNTQNCVSLFLYTQCMGPFELWKHAKDYILAHFEQVVQKNRDFLHMTKDHLLQMITTDRLTVNSESTVYKAVITWVNFDPDSRNCHLPTLLEQVAFPLMSPTDLEILGKDSKVKRYNYQKLSNGLTSHC